MIMRAAALFAGAFVAMLPTLPVLQQDPGAISVEDPEAYAVYASLLPSEWTVRTAHAKTRVFQEETGMNWRCLPSGKPLEEDWRPVVDSFRSENAKPRRLRAGFRLGTPYLVVPSADIAASLHDVRDDPNLGWDGFYRRYPDSGGFMVVSAVAFDASKQRAMVYMAHFCGSLCGGGMHHLLEKVGVAWQEARLPGVSNCAWAS